MHVFSRWPWRTSSRHPVTLSQLCLWRDFSAMMWCIVYFVLKQSDHFKLLSNRRFLYCQILLDRQNNKLSFGVVPSRIISHYTGWDKSVIKDQQSWHRLHVFEALGSSNVALNHLWLLWVCLFIQHGTYQSFHLVFDLFCCIVKMTLGSRFII